MNAKHKPLTPKDFGLAPSELKEVVTGAQTFLPPAPDPREDERFVPVPVVDATEGEDIS